MPAEVQPVSKIEKASAFQDAALALINEREKAAAPASPPAPQAAAQVPGSGVETPLTPAVTPGAETPPAVAEPEPPAPQGFDRLAQEKAQLRKRAQEQDAREKKHARVLEVLERGGSALEILAASGKSYKDAATEVLQGGKFPAAAPAPADNPVAKEVADLKQMLMQEREQRAKAELTSQAVKLATEQAEKYKNVTALGRAPQAVEFLNQYFVQTGELPIPNDLPGSLSAAMDYVESQSSREIQQNIGILQKLGYQVTKTAAGSIPQKPAVQQPASVQGTQSRTLSNSQAAPSLAAPPPPEPKTPEEFRRLALQKFEEMEAKGPAAG